MRTLGHLQLPGAWRQLRAGNTSGEPGTSAPRYPAAGLRTGSLADRLTAESGVTERSAAAHGS
jgi:hypothetical protein